LFENRKKKKGMLLLTTSAFPTVRFIPPLNVTATEVQLALDIFAEAVRLASAKKSEFLLKK
jgi:4-aminobutyrate aminotransferase